jgi:hypothetical protein
VVESGWLGVCCRGEKLSFCVEFCVWSVAL